ncbi:cation transporter MgtC/SapB [Neoasaia chiangmaiensis NBRC 101099]|uniref:Protein MgtC n=1 Tax=Neoasaia chiangmaiensis TaxID=320497 RepID=A0A1U9KPN0_9PROT|nr:MgtC/SapB family protein [Neoasaia chiangmaiensis]AQS87781.1 hypothetical protein A0U93_07345 [Neoasaia chiangmaiensis]GBR41576.1 cation transporter MgtC/SapB [Neoasaia chiangmaiensis NBRC 101099]GEN14384.1 membrane protein [Neoasaia chiangmaiensis]
MHAFLPFGTAAGQGWLQFGELGLAFLLAGIVGLEREYRQKSAGFRTYTLVGVASALFVLVSKYGFDDVLAPGRVVLDPSRVAAQIVSGLGFIGGGVIFMRRDAVRGLTTAASIWLTAALGMACGAGMTALALATTAGYLFVMFVTPRLLRHFPSAKKPGFIVAVAGVDDAGLPDRVRARIRELGFSTGHMRLERDVEDGTISIVIRIRGPRGYGDLLTGLMRVPGVTSARSESGSNALE